MDFIKECNLENDEKLHRIIIGILIFLAALVGFGKVFFMILGILLAVSGVVGWCTIPYLIHKINKK
ncbi:MAG TPA: DUF2892 domain-containing protein [Legionellales bacterium]|nr:DUF2892 domain-containing protein [Legionellales bacterium]